MVRRWSKLFVFRTLVWTLCSSGAVFCSVTSAAGSPPAPSTGCGQTRLPSRDYNSADWPIRQSGSNGQVIGRTYIMHVPRQHEQPQGQPLPIVFNLHGTGGNGAAAMKGSQMREAAAAHGFVVVAPDAWPWSTWTTGESQVEARHGFSDVKFIEMLLDLVVEKLCVDHNRIYVTGGSNGGIMSTTLANASADGKLGTHKIAAIAPVLGMPVPWEIQSLAAGAAIESSLGEQLFRAHHSLLSDARADVSGDGISFCSIGARPRREAVPMHVFWSSEDRLVANGACYGTYRLPISRLEATKRDQLRTLLCACYGPDARGGSRRCASDPGIQGRVDTLVWLARCTAHRWAVENGCARTVSEPAPTGKPTGWGQPIQRVTHNCGAVANSRGDTILTIFDTAERPGHPNSVDDPDPGGHIWPGGIRPDGVEEGSFKITNEIWAFFESHPR